MTLSYIPNRGRSRDEAIEYWRPRGQRHDPSHRTYDYSGAFPFASDILRQGTVWLVAHLRQPHSRT